MNYKIKFSLLQITAYRVSSDEISQPRESITKVYIDFFTHLNVCDSEGFGAITVQLQKKTM